MIELVGTASLVISKSTKLPFNDATAKFDAANIRKVRMVEVELMDGSLHTIDVGEHFFNWEDYEEIEEATTQKVPLSSYLNDTHVLKI